jgi:uncharacterized protein (TIGR03437 family)
VTGAFTVTAVPLSTAVTLRFSLTNTPPRLVSNSVVNGASFQSGPVAPGEIVSVFGAGVGPAQLAVAAPGADGRYGTELAGVRVLFNGVAAPVLYTRFDQVGAVIPYTLAGADSAQVEVEFAGTTSNTTNVPVAEASPGVFSLDSSGRGQSAILNQDGTVNGSSNPAQPGSVVAIYATGGGQTEPPSTDGEVVSGPRSLALAVRVTIGGLPAKVLYAGAAPALVAGVVQINVEVPQGVPSGDVAVMVTIDEVSSQGDATVAIR